MSIFPTGGATNGPRFNIPGREARLEAEGVLVRPISGQVYLIEETELEAPATEGTQSRLSQLISRH